MEFKYKYNGVYKYWVESMEASLEYLVKTILLESIRRPYGDEYFLSSPHTVLEKARGEVDISPYSKYYCLGKFTNRDLEILADSKITYVVVKGKKRYRLNVTKIVKSIQNKKIEGKK